MSETINTQDLKNTISKLENLEAEKAELMDTIKDAYDEAKHKGYDVKIIRHVLKLKKKGKDELSEEDELIALYRGALDL